MPQAEVFVSVVLPVHDDGAELEGFAGEVLDVLEREYANYELVIIDDGSRDGTAEAAKRVLRARRCVRYVRLAKHYGRERAVSAGLDTVIGDVAVIMSVASDPPAMIVPTIRDAAAGEGVLFGVHGGPMTGSLLDRLGARLFHAYCRRFLGIVMPRRLTGYAVLSRQAINSLVRLRGKGNYLRLLDKYTGLSSTQFAYEPARRPAGTPAHERLGHRIGTAVDIIISNSAHPLRAVAFLGLAAGGLNLLYMLYVAAIYLIKKDVQPGWTTSSLQSSVMFFFVFLILAVFAEYLGRLMNQVVGEDPYAVVEEATSSIVLADADRLNVVARTERTDDERVRH